MKKTNRAISFFLVVLMSLCVAAPAAFAVAEEGRSEYPIIYIMGRTDELETADGEHINAVDVDTEYVKQEVKKDLPEFAKAVASNDWAEYSKVLAASVAPVFDPIQLDDNGEIANGSHLEWTWSRDTLWNPGNGYYLYDYCFPYDYRLSPCDNADILARFIDDVLYVTGCDKVNIVGRCEGSVIVTAYLAEYGCDKLCSLELYCSAANGIDELSAIFSGRMAFDLKSIDRYADNYLVADDYYLGAFLKATISLAKTDLGMNLSAAAIERIYEKIYRDVLPEVILASYGKMPGFWSMIDESCYDDAMQLVFSGKQEQYAKLIAKIEEYHAIKLRADEILTQAQDSGVNIGVIAKYGYACFAFSADCKDELSDGFATLEKTSYGATSAKQDETLGDEYIAAREALGLGKYISPDKTVDASTCLFPDRTWIIKGIEHTTFPDSINRLIMKFFCCGGNMTVESDEGYPQFTVYDYPTDTLSRMTDENHSTEGWSKSFAETLRRFFEAYFALLKNIFERLFK